MDCKIIKFFLLIFFVSFKSYAVEFNGKFIQGHYIIGKTDPNSTVTIDKIKVKVSKDGYFAFGLDRERKYDVVIKIKKDGKYKGFHVTSLEDRKRDGKETMVPRSFEDVKKFQIGSKRTISKKNEWKMRPCYKDLKDKTSLVWTVAHLDYNPWTK